MRNLLLAAVLSLAGPACAEEAKPAPAATGAADMAKLRAVPQQLQAEHDHFDYTPASDSAVVTGYTRALPEKNSGETGSAPPPEEGGVAVAGRGRKGAGPQAQILITDKLRDLGIDTGPVGVGVRGKGIVLSIKY